MPYSNDNFNELYEERDDYTNFYENINYYKIDNFFLGTDTDSYPKHDRFYGHKCKLSNNEEYIFTNGYDMAKLDLILYNNDQDSSYESICEYIKEVKLLIGDKIIVQLDSYELLVYFYMYNVKIFTNKCNGKWIHRFKFPYIEWNFESRIPILALRYENVKVKVNYENASMDLCLFTEYYNNDQRRILAATDFIFLQDNIKTYYSGLVQNEEIINIPELEKKVKYLLILVENVNVNSEEDLIESLELVNRRSICSSLLRSNETMNVDLPVNMYAIPFVHNPNQNSGFMFNKKDYKIKFTLNNKVDKLNIKIIAIEHQYLFIVNNMCYIIGEYNYNYNFENFNSLKDDEKNEYKKRMRDIIKELKTKKLK
jgi:hypothetical protein